MKKKPRIRDISARVEPLVEITTDELMPLPSPYEAADRNPPIEPLSAEQQEKYESSLDGVAALGLEKPKSREEEERLVGSFLNGLKKLLTREDNWTFLQPLVLSLENCAKCQNCSDACPVFLASGRQEAYRPTFRSEALRRIIRKYLNQKNPLLSRFEGNDVELNWRTAARLGELAYRCTLCRRCTQSCPLGVDNGLIAHEIRKIFSQELGLAPKALHAHGTVQQLKAGSSTGLAPKAFKGIVRFMEEEIEEKTGKSVKIPVDKEGAEVLLVHNSGEFLSWLENPIAFAILFESAGVSWTLSSQLGGYEATNYGVWYDDIQFARIARRQADVARKLKVKKIVVGECGHAHKALAVVADRLFSEETEIPRESYLPLVEDIVCHDRIRLDPRKNDFPVTLHDPCNVVRLMGIVEPQRKILRKVCPQFREMTPSACQNHCCGGGSGLVNMDSTNFRNWGISVAGRMKFKQILEAFQDVKDPAIPKYVCLPCSNCKGQMRDVFNFYRAQEKSGLYYGGLVELVVNAMTDLGTPFLPWTKRP